jgi:hypothetical protein
MRKYKVNESYFDILNDNSAYWLGFLYADGYVRMKDGRSGELKLKLKDTDKDHIEKFLTEIESNHPIKCGIDNKSKFCQVSVNSTIMVKRLFELGCDNKKTFKIRFPELPLNLMNHFIRGYFDGDGSVCKIKGKWDNVSIAGNQNFIESLKKYLLGYDICKINIYDQGKIKILKLTNISDIIKFKKFIYNNDTISLDRKKNRFNDVNGDFVSKEEFLKLIKEKNLTTFGKYVSHISRNKLSRFPRNPESEYNFKF